MNRNAEEIRQRLTMREVVEHYGFQVDRANCIRCPFHAGDRQASLHIYPGSGGFHCFGCGAHGSVIDFAMLLFNCSFREAMGRLNSDFNLGIGISRPITYRERKARQSAIMAVREIRDYMENGNIVHSVNFPDCSMGACTTAGRIGILHRNVSGMISQYSTTLGDAGMNIAGMEESIAPNDTPFVA